MSPGGIGGGRGGGGTRWMGGTGNQQYTAMVFIQKRFFGDDSANSTPVCPERWARMQRGAKWTGVLGTQKLEGLRCTFSPYGGEGELLHTNGAAQWVCMGDVNGGKAALLPPATHGGRASLSFSPRAVCGLLCGGGGRRTPGVIWEGFVSLSPRSHYSVFTPSAALTFCR